MPLDTGHHGRTLTLRAPRLAVGTADESTGGFGAGAFSSGPDEIGEAVARLGGFEHAVFTDAVFPGGGLGARHAGEAQERDDGDRPERCHRNGSSRALRPGRGSPARATPRRLRSRRGSSTGDVNARKGSHAHRPGFGGTTPRPTDRVKSRVRAPLPAYCHADDGMGSSPPCPRTAMPMTAWAPRPPGRQIPLTAPGWRCSRVRQPRFVEDEFESMAVRGGRTKSARSGPDATDEPEGRPKAPRARRASSG